MKIVITHAIDSGESVGGKNKAKIEKYAKSEKTQQQCKMVKQEIHRATHMQNELVKMQNIKNENANKSQ